MLNVTKMSNNREINIKRRIINQIVRSLVNLESFFGISVTLIYVHLNHKRMQLLKEFNEYQWLPVPFPILRVDFEQRRYLKNRYKLNLTQRQNTK